jgi:nitroreductase
MDLFEAIEKRASVRDLEPVDLPQPDLLRILDAGRRAPSGVNRQPYHLLVIKNPDTLRRLAEAQECIGRVSLAIAVVAHPDESKYWLEDMSAVTQNMLLVITALGYASVWIEGRLMSREDEWKALLDVPAKDRLMVVLPIGRPKGPAVQKEKRPLAEVVYQERWGRPLLAP